MAEGSVAPLVPHLFLLSLTFSLSLPSALSPRSFNLMVLMDSVSYATIGSVIRSTIPLLRCAVIGSDWNRIGWAPALRHGYGTAGDGGRAVTSCSLLSDRSSWSSIRL